MTFVLARFVNGEEGLGVNGQLNRLTNPFISTTLYIPSFASSSATSMIVLMIESAFKLMESIPSSTRKRAKSG
jgi:hypothetical protein